MTSVLQRLESSRASHLIAQPPATSDVSSPSSSLNVTEKRSSSASDLTRMAALDARLAQLEKAVGGNVVRPLSGLLSEVASGGVAERLATLQGRVSLLEAEPVALIEERVRRATLTLDEFRKRQTQANSVEDPAFAALVRIEFKSILDSFFTFSLNSFFFFFFFLIVRFVKLGKGFRNGKKASPLFLWWSLVFDN